MLMQQPAYDSDCKARGCHFCQTRFDKQPIDFNSTRSRITLGCCVLWTTDMLLVGDRERYNWAPQLLESWENLFPDLLVTRGTSSSNSGAIAEVMIQAPPCMDIIYDTEHDHNALTKQISDDKDLAVEPASFAQRAKKWGMSIANGKRINDQFYGKLLPLKVTCFKPVWLWLRVSLTCRYWSNKPPVSCYLLGQDTGDFRSRKDSNY